MPHAMPWTRSQRRARTAFMTLAALFLWLPRDLMRQDNVSR